MSMLCMTWLVILTRIFSTPAPWMGRSRCGLWTVFQSASNLAYRQWGMIKYLQQSNLNYSQGPTGEGADFGGLGGGTASLEHEPTTVRKLVFQGGKLYAGDVMGSLCRFWMFYQR